MSEGPQHVTWERVGRRQTLVEAVLSALTQRIVGGLMDGSLHPGDQLPSEGELTRQLEVGRSTFREAIKILHVLGLVDVQPGRGTFIAQDATIPYLDPLSWGLILGHRSFDEILEARIILEAASAALAAERVSAENVALLEKRFARMEQAAAVRDRSTYVDADVAFHVAISEMSRNTVLSHFVITLRRLIEAWIAKALEDPDVLASSIAEHRRILEAVRAKDANGARAAMADHLNRAASNFREAVGAARPSPRESGSKGGNETTGKTSE